MTTLAIPYTSVFLTASQQPTGSDANQPTYNATKDQRIFDFRSEDALKVLGAEHEIDLDDYFAAQDPQTQQAINEAGSWVANTFYADQKTLATLRLRAGLTQKALAEKCGIEQPHISRYESGRIEPGLVSAGKMASALGVSLDEFAEAFNNSSQ